MAAVAGPATPQRPLPGAFAVTPAPAPTIFAGNAATLRQNAPPAPQESGNAPSNPATTITPVERGARTINDTLEQESRFPELESYITQGISSKYEMPMNQAWMPFQKLRQHDLPPKVLEQANHSGVGMLMGIFAPLGHAWVAFDNCLYLWDYNLPNPDLIGWEENSHPIQTINLVKPKPGVFVEAIQHLIVVTTNSEMILLGVATQPVPGGAEAVSLYNTRMSIPVRGLSVNFVVGSEKTGRIFFVASQSDDIYEFQYQQEEGWFSGRTARKCHTSTQLSILQENITAVGQLFGPAKARKWIQQLVIDDSRNLMYSLSNTGDIKIWSLRNDLIQVLYRTLDGMLTNIGHFSAQSDLLQPRSTKLVGLSVIPSTEAGKVALMGLTNTGCRLYISTTRGYAYPGDAQNPPTNMQILHIRFPPKDSNRVQQSSPQQQSSQTAMTTYGSRTGDVDTSSRILDGSKEGFRFRTGYFLDVLSNPNRPGADRIFCSAPNSAHIGNRTDQQTQMHQRFSEFGMFLDLPGVVHEIVATNPEVAGATSAPMGYGNELAIQFDKASPQFALVTSNAIQIVRRKRLVDIFAGLMRFGTSEGSKSDLTWFSDAYGPSELAATALAVACGQGMDVSTDSRLSKITEPEVPEGGRKVFIEYGVQQRYDPPNPSAVAASGPPIDRVIPSSRHSGMALYISRLVRSIWKATIIREDAKPGTPPQLSSTIATTELVRIQQDLTALVNFLNTNSSMIAGLSGPQSGNKPMSRDAEIALEGEHRALSSLRQLASSIVEGISFVLVLFENRVEEILAALGEDSRSRVKRLTFEDLFVSNAGRDLARELVKAIVNRNIANGSNVDTVAEALRKKCGSFCSDHDVIIFKAQEQVKRASEAGSQSETNRVLLNESLRLFQKVAESLSMEHLAGVTEQYVQMAFYAGAIQLCLAVAGRKDIAKLALKWLKDGMPESDSRRSAFDARKPCYDLVFWTIQSLDEQTRNSPDAMNGQSTVAARRRNEAYVIINSSEDAVFQTCLYDWYVSIDQADRLLEIDTHNVIDYLNRRSQEDRFHADLLWRYHAHHNDYLKAASVQLDLARGYFDLSLEERIEYLSRARTNASTRQTALMDSRQSKQQLLREISDLLDVANIQDDLFQRMKSEPRLTGERREQVLGSLNGPVLPIDELFNQYADQASYYDICILIYHVADHRNPADIKASWQSLIDQTDDQAQALYGRRALPWETVGEKVQELGRRLNLSDATFPIQTLLPMLEKYFMEPREALPPMTWVPDLFLGLDIPHETLLPVMEQMFYGNEHPFVGSKRKVLAGQMIYLLRSWFTESERKGERVPFGSEENASMVMDAASSLMRGVELDVAARKDAELLVSSIQRAIR